MAVTAPIFTKLILTQQLFVSKSWWSKMAAVHDLDFWPLPLNHTDGNEPLWLTLNHMVFFDDVKPQVKVIPRSWIHGEMKLKFIVPFHEDPQIVQ